MKKTGKRLGIDRETLKNLRIEEIRQVQGAGLGSFVNCSTTCKTFEISRCVCATI